MRLATVELCDVFLRAVRGGLRREFAIVMETSIAMEERSQEVNSIDELDVLLSDQNNDV
jgi:hypothetical protein